jgi:DNA excision repair protein ERCC-3
LRRQPRTVMDLSALFDYNDFAYFTLKPDHVDKPLWVCRNGHIFLETNSPSYLHMTDFLIAIAEPVSRPEHIHEYILTRYSLYAAVSVKLETDYIIRILQAYCKTQEIPPEVIEFIQENTEQYGKAKLVLKKGNYFIESTYEGVISDLLKIKSVKEAKEAAVLVPQDIADTHVEDVKEEMIRIMDGEAMEIEEKVESICVASDMIEQVRKDCHEQNFPLIEEYDFLKDDKSPRLEIDLKPSTHIRSYQEKSLSKMFSNGRARSGVIVLPCGSGKTLVGITAVCTVKKRVVILCTSGVAVEQWRRQFLMWSTIDPASIITFTSLSKDKAPQPTKACIVISTYSMMGYSGKRSVEAANVYEKISQVDWGLLVMDEVQVVPADMFRKVIYDIKSHCKLGLTATLVREDDKIEELNFLIGPKLYEANWLDMQTQGFIAKVQCVEVWCPMTADFFQEYLNAKPRKKILLYVANPNKLMTCQYLVKKHEEMGDKIIIFSDNLYVLELYSKYLNLPMISGSVSHNDRMKILFSFENTNLSNTILVSKVGDNSIDLPGANVIIQISSHFGSRRQEAQRLGRILRPKASSAEAEFNAYFYSLVSQDTQEMWYADKRQQFLIDQGYAYKVVSLTEEVQRQSELLFTRREDQKTLLEKLLQAKDVEDEAQNDVDDITPENNRRNVDLGSMSTGLSVQRSYKLQLKPRNKLFAMRYKALKK